MEQKLELDKVRQKDRIRGPWPSRKQRQIQPKALVTEYQPGKVRHNRLGTSEPDEDQPSIHAVSRLLIPASLRLPISHKGQKAKSEEGNPPISGSGEGENPQHFASPNEHAKLVRAVANLVRRERLDYEGFRRLSADVRKELGLRRPPRSRRLPHVLPEASLAKFFDAIRQGGNLQHEIMLKLLFYTAIRVSELVGIRVEQIDLDACKIFIEQAKGGKDRYILYPESFRLVLQSHLAANPENRFLFESRQRTKYTTRRVQQIVAEYAEAADLPDRIHPHLLRHQMLTWLTAQGMPDSQIQLISGHASKKSLEVYQHLSLASVQPGYQRAVKGLEV